MDYYSFQLIRPNDGFRGLNQYFALSKSSDEILSFSTNEIISLFDALDADASSEENWSHKLLPFQTIIASTLSPDGHYVMLLSINHGTIENPTISRHLYLLRLDDLSIREVEGLDPSSILVGVFGTDYPPVIEWNTDTMIFGTSEGIQAYQFEIE